MKQVELFMHYQKYNPSLNAVYLNQRDIPMYYS